VKLLFESNCKKSYLFLDVNRINMNISIKVLQRSLPYQEKQFELNELPFAQQIEIFECLARKINEIIDLKEKQEDHNE